MYLQLYTVVHNVKEAHECQEYGETQEFCDDIDYIMDGLGDSQVTATRCLRLVSWSQTHLIHPRHDFCYTTNPSRSLAIQSMDSYYFAEH